MRLNCHQIPVPSDLVTTPGHWLLHLQKKPPNEKSLKKIEA